MNRSLKVFVATVLALSLCLSFGSALAKKQDKPPKPTKAAIDTITLSLFNRAGKPLALVDDAYTVVTGQKYTVKADVTPPTAKPRLRWRSSKPGVANVDSRGNVFCVRPGKEATTITATSKSGATKSIILNVMKNEATFGEADNNPVRKIYLKGKNLMVDVVIVNDSATETQETVPDLEFSLKLASGEYPNPVVRSGHLRSEIPANGNGIAVYKIGKVDPRTVWLLDATVSCKVPD